jgi:starch synthase
MTIHNMAFQGYYPADVFPRLGLPPEAWAVNGVEYHGGVGFLKAGLESAYGITTVSPTYALEIRSPQFGMGLEGLIQSRGDNVRGIVNGIDAKEWIPSRIPPSRLISPRAPWPSGWPTSVRWKRNSGSIATMVRCLSSSAA